MVKILIQTASDSVMNYLKLLNMYIKPQIERLTQKAIATVKDYLRILNVLGND